MNASTIRIAIALCCLGAALPVAAADVRAKLTPELIYSHCLSAGVGSQAEGTFMLPGGRVTGTVHCTEADVSASNMPSPNRERDDDDHDRGGRGHDDGDGSEGEDDN